MLRIQKMIEKGELNLNMSVAVIVNALVIVVVVEKRVSRRLPVFGLS